MSTTPASATPAEPPKRIKKRIYIPTILIVLLLLIVIGAYLRGSWADDVEKNPKTPADGTITQLYRKDNHNVQVRCAVVVDAPSKEVWAVVTDYPSHASFLPYVNEVSGTKLDDGRYLVKGVAHSRLYGDWPFESKTKHIDHGDDFYETAWSEEETDKEIFHASRGGWIVKPLPGNTKQTLLVFALQVELKHYPDFIVRNIIMDRLHSVVKKMGEEAVERKKREHVDQVPD